ncbi:MAG: hypothetical protein NC123_16875 [Butyrivibrio sp.]|nr:hypothetical protein [Acetatifactor muris]MCM1561192.1 hypothetical protein [Butyrivibrio sp.]
MTAQEVFTAIGKSCEVECYNIVYLVNNYKMEEAVSEIQRCFDCDKKAAEEVACMIKAKLRK